MTQHLEATTRVAKAAEPGGFWLGASYLLWPNSKINPTSRGKQSPEERREWIRQWRSMPDPVDWPAVLCEYCDRPACGWYGKVDIPLGASREHRNTTAPGHEGTPLCYPCLASLWAFPYGADLGGGRAAAIHSWDSEFLARMTQVAVERTLAVAGLPPQKTKIGPYGREHAVLTAVRNYGHRLRAGVELIVLSNSNKEQYLRTQEMAQPVAEWLRSTARDADRRAGYSAVVAAQATKTVPGEAFLAKRAFTDPEAVFHRTTAYLLEQVSVQGAIPVQVRRIAPLMSSYCIEVLRMDEKDFTRITELAGRVAALLGQDSRPGPFRDFIRANARGGNLDGWFRTQAVDWLVKSRPAGTPKTLISAKECRLLFDDDKAWTYRRLLVYAVIEALAERDWQPKGSREDLDDIADAAATITTDNTEEQ
ncbi:hypothetical protein IU450_34945 [Nocardia abscessus]|uniref:hypothetical protein n=1 Tax=Nocardia abscessus TaxID=120957 RepID=UPI001893EE68|nr:hypothetical protein [Nocardia abscessus]MBF6341053.1 hypothetical protein [Nocardia abscessus]